MANVATSDEEIVKTSVRLKKSLHKELRQYCLDTDKKVVDVISEAVAEYIKRHSKR